MKKVMIAAAVAAVAGIAGAIESANTVGYASATSGADNNFITVPFNAVGYNTSDIQQIAISDGGAGTIGWGTEMFSIWEGVPTVADGSEFIYYDPSVDPETDPDKKATTYYWGDASCAKVTYSIPAGQGVVINCAADLTISIEPPYSL